MKKAIAILILVVSASYGQDYTNAPVTLGNTLYGFNKEHISYDGAGKTWDVEITASILIPLALAEDLPNGAELRTSSSVLSINLRISQADLAAQLGVAEADLGTQTQDAVDAAVDAIVQEVVDFIASNYGS